MIDSETLDTASTTVILSVGLVKFNPLSNTIISKLELKPTIDEQTEKYNRTISESTLTWWSQQAPEAIEEAMGDAGRISFEDCMKQVYSFCWNADAVWSNGSVFDIMIMEDAFKNVGMKTPWPFWSIRDCRTLYDVAKVSLKDDGYVTSHKCLEDAERQTIIVQRAYSKLVKAGFTHLR